MRIFEGNASYRARSKFMGRGGSRVSVATTAKNPEIITLRDNTVEKLIKWTIFMAAAGTTIEQVCCSSKRVRLDGEGHRGMGHESTKVVINGAKDALDATILL
jgi:hypothetical protein